MERYDVSLIGDYDEYLTYCACMRDVPAQKIKEAVTYAKERCGITHFSARLIKNLSGGYRQRVGIAQAIIHQPLLVVMDEPTNGLDPNQILEVRALIKEIAKERAVIISTHILSEVQALCRDIKMIDGGKIVFSDSIDAFNNFIAPHSLVIRLDNPPSKERMESLPNVTKVEFISDFQLRVYYDADKHAAKEITDALVKTSVAENWQLQELGTDKHAMDEIFAHLSNHKK